MYRLLVVEDSKFFLNLIIRGFEHESDIEVVTATSLAEARATLESAEVPFAAALIDLRLPDAQDGEVVSLALADNIPTVIFTSNFDENIRENFLEMGVLDLVLKDNPSSLEYLQRLVRRIIRNRDTKVLVVDDSSVARRMCTSLLEKYQLDVYEACDGVEALKMLDNHEDIKLVVTDHEMPEMCGFDFVTEIRRKRDRNQLAIIGVSGSGGAPLSAKFLKHGANDFIAKPYLPEELYTRVAQNLEVMESIELLTTAATKDFLTGLYNRRSFFDLGGRIASSRSRAKKSVAIAMMDIDFFKKVNDAHGHDAGDAVLKSVADTVLRHTGRGGDLCARLGGEEFAIMLEADDPSKTSEYFETLRSNIEKQKIQYEDRTIPVTASFGVVISDKPEIEPMLTAADENLYRAKNEGRNRVVVA
ncbi:MAG: diguanylate cyclase [Rhodospirillales bacterium]|nr:diguanylate cyclase [Rhodospirillales bacterium]